MKTTLELPDRIYREIKARAALRGQTIKDFFLDAVRDKLASEKSHNAKTGWRAVFGKASQKDIDEVQKLVDEEFSRVEPEDWR
jgi:Antitoxin ParD